MQLKKNIVFSLLEMQCLFMNEKKTYYYDLSIEEMEKIKKSGFRPTLGIHVCCGPCAAFPLEFLNEVFKIVIIYTNSNIYPQSEYNRRLDELKRYVSIFNNEHNADITLVEFEYDNIAYNECLKPYKDEVEGGNRCFFCYEKRMDEAYRYADEHNFDYFTTVMTISRQKNSVKLNEIGNKLSKKYRPKYFYSDFKKNRGIDRGVELRKKYNMYNQQYCGCIYSYQAYLDKNNLK